MRRLIGRLLPRRIAAQSAAVVVASVVLIQLGLTVYFRLLEDHAVDRRRGFVHVGTLVRLMAATEPGPARARLVADAVEAFPTLSLDFGKTPPPIPAERSGAPPPDRSPGPPFGEFGPQISVVDLDGPPNVRWTGGLAFGPGPRHLAFGLSGGEWLTVAEPSPPSPPFFLGPLGASLVFAGLSSLLLGLWAARGLVGPLRALAAAARDFDIEAEPEPLPRRGPEEIRVAASAFEAMRRRIRSLVEDRTRMLAAMGHDLRTPITRLRLRAEFIGDETLRAELLRDLAGMSEMIDGALTYLAEGRHRETRQLVDLSAMIQTLCDQHVDLGGDVEYAGPDHALRRVRPTALGRAIANLLDNARKYGSHCIVRLVERADGGVLIEVEDDGPGIPGAEREAMLRPFVRGDTARNMDDQRGFGLGLAIVKAVVDGHGGRLAFADAEPHGLVVRIELPPEDDGGPTPV